MLARKARGDRFIRSHGKRRSRQTLRISSNRQSRPSASSKLKFGLSNRSIFENLRFNKEVRMNKVYRAAHGRGTSDLRRRSRKRANRRNCGGRRLRPTPMGRLGMTPRSARQSVDANGRERAAAFVLEGFEGALSQGTEDVANAEVARRRSRGKTIALRLAGRPPALAIDVRLLADQMVELRSWNRSAGRSADAKNGMTNGKSILGDPPEPTGVCRQHGEVKRTKA